MKAYPFALMLAVSLAGYATVSAQTITYNQVPVLALGASSTATGQNWYSDGFLTLNGATVGLDVTVALSGGNDDIRYEGGQSQYTTGGTIQFLDSTTSSAFGFAGTNQSEAVIVGTNMAADVAANGSTLLLISEVAPVAGDYYLDGVKVTATTADQVLQWTAPVADLIGPISTSDSILQNEFVFTSDATFDLANGGPVGISGGPIGFSATDVPEPSTWALMVGGLGLLLGIGRCRLGSLSLR